MIEQEAKRMSESERDAAALLAFLRLENYVRTLRQAIRGLGSQLVDNPDLFREAFALEMFAEEIADWLKGQQSALKAEVEGRSEVAKPQVATNAAILH